MAVTDGRLGDGRRGLPALGLSTLRIVLWDCHHLSSTPGRRWHANDVDELIHQLVYATARSVSGASSSHCCSHDETDGGAGRPGRVVRWLGRCAHRLLSPIREHRGWSPGRVPGSWETSNGRAVSGQEASYDGRGPFGEQQGGVVGGGTVVVAGDGARETAQGFRAGSPAAAWRSTWLISRWMPNCSPWVSRASVTPSV